MTAPFKFLGSLFKGAEDAQFVHFAPGSAALEPPAAAALATLAKGLVQKPGIRLEVPAGVAPELDRPALIEQRYQEQLDAPPWPPHLHRSEGDAAPLPAFSTLQAQAADRYPERPGGKTDRHARPSSPSRAAPPEGTSRAEAKAMREAAAIEFLQKEAHAHLTAPDEALDALGVSALGGDPARPADRHRSGARAGVRDQEGQGQRERGQGAPGTGAAVGWRSKRHAANSMPAFTLKRVFRGS